MLTLTTGSIFYFVQEIKQILSYVINQINFFFLSLLQYNLLFFISRGKNFSASFMLIVFIVLFYCSSYCSSIKSGVQERSPEKILFFSSFESCIWPYFVTFLLKKRGYNYSGRCDRTQCTPPPPPQLRAWLMTEN